MTASVLVLNATYEPISHTRLARAVAMVNRGEAVVEEAMPGRILRHAKGSMPWPKVLRLLRFVKLPYRHGPAQFTKRGVLQRDNHRCGYCGRTAKTVDHIIPTSRGGERRDWLNTVAACQACNNKKADRTPVEAGMTLQVTPYAPVAR